MVEILQLTFATNADLNQIALSSISDGSPSGDLLQIGFLFLYIFIVAQILAQFGVHQPAEKIRPVKLTLYYVVGAVAAFLWSYGPIYILAEIYDADFLLLLEQVIAGGGAVIGGITLIYKSYSSHEQNRNDRSAVASKLRRYGFILLISGFFYSWYALAHYIESQAVAREYGAKEWSCSKPFDIQAALHYLSFAQEDFHKINGRYSDDIDELKSVRKMEISPHIEITIKKADRDVYLMEGACYSDKGKVRMRKVRSFNRLESDSLAKP